MQPASVLTVRIGGLLTEPGSLTDALGQILGQVANMAARFLTTPKNALDVHLLPETHHVGGFGQPFAGLLPARQRHPGGRVGESPRSGVPYREPVVGVAQLVVGGPPHLVIGRLGDRPQLRPGNRAPDGGMEVRCPAFLGFDGAEVLHIPADTAAGVLPEPVHQGREVDRIPSRPPIVIVRRVDRRAVGIDAAVGIQGEGQEGGGPVATCEDPGSRVMFMPLPAFRAPGGGIQPAAEGVGRELVEVSVSGVECPSSGRFAAAVELGPRDAGGFLADLVRRCATLAHSITEDHVDLGLLVKPHRDLDGEQVPEVDDLLSWVLDLPDHAHPRSPALGQDGLQGCVGSFAKAVIGLVGDHVSQLVDDQQHKRLPAGR
jgi:hypothetical protein